MKTLFVALLAGLFLFCGPLYAQKYIRDDAYDQLTRAERREWRQMARHYRRNPQLLKAFTEEHQTLMSANLGLMGEIAELKSERDGYLEQITQLEAQLTLLTNQLEDKPGIPLEAEIPPAAYEDNPRIGVVFSVQIGAYKEAALPETLDRTEVIKMEETPDFQKIVIGQYRDPGKAEQLKKFLRRMGVNDAWIVSYKDGVRVPIKEALRAIRP